jgi:hypothetical protein
MMKRMRRRGGRRKWWRLSFKVYKYELLSNQDRACI